MHYLYPHPQSDVVQLNAPDYDPDIDGQPDPVTDLQSLNAKSIKEDTMPNTANSKQHTALSMDTNRPQSQPSSVLVNTSTKMMNTQGQNTLVITVLNWKTSQN